VQVAGRAQTLTLRVTPRSAKPGVGPWRDGVLQVRVSPPPVEGDATGAALAAVAEALHVPRSTVRLVHGKRSRLKRVAIDRLTMRQLSQRLEDLGSEPD